MARTIWALVTEGRPVMLIILFTPVVYFVFAVFCAWGLSALVQAVVTLLDR
jgi:hypothetical protein